MSAENMSMIQITLINLSYTHLYYECNVNKCGHEFMVCCTLVIERIFKFRHHVYHKILVFWNINTIYNWKFPISLFSNSIIITS